MQKGITFKNLILDIWLLDKLIKAPAPGISLEELQAQWSKHPSGSGVLSRTTFNRHRSYLNDMFGVNIECHDNKHYYVTNPECLKLRTLANDLLASMHEFLFLDEYRDLGDAIQPSQILSGIEYLHPIGDAIRNHKKLKIKYQKFTDSEPYEAILHPYCLKADNGRWYLLAVKDESETTLKPSEAIGTTLKQIRVYALDRTLSLEVLDGQYVVDKTINVSTYFRDAYGIWVDPEHYPVQDITIEVTPWVANYLKTLPIHHSQKQLSPTEFQYHISPTPDFLNELRKWGEDLKITSNIIINK